MEPRWIKPDDPEYPPRLKQHLDGRAPSSFAVIGNPAPLLGNTVGLICSINCPGSVIIKTYDAIREIRDAGVTVIGGFHSPMEKECLSILLRREQPVVACPARSLEGMQIPREWRRHVEAGRLLLLSPFSRSKRRPTAELAGARNSFVASAASTLLVAHAAAGGKVWALCQRRWRQGLPIWTINDAENRELLAVGAVPYAPRSIRQL